MIKVVFFSILIFNSYSQNFIFKDTMLIPEPIILPKIQNVIKDSVLFKGYLLIHLKMNEDTISPKEIYWKNSLDDYDKYFYFFAPLVWFERSMKFTVHMNRIKKEKYIKSIPKIYKLYNKMNKSHNSSYPWFLLNQGLKSSVFDKSNLYKKNGEIFAIFKNEFDAAIIAVKVEETGKIEKVMIPISSKYKLASTDAHILKRNGYKLYLCKN